MPVESPEAATHAAEAPVEAPTTEPTQPGLGQTLAALHSELTHAVHERLHLAALEFRQLSVNTTQMVMLATAAGVMAASAWIAVLMALFKVCTDQGMPWGAALLLILAVNLAGTALAWAKVMALSKAFAFPATLRMFNRQAANAPEA